MSSNIERLGNVLGGRMKQTASAAVPIGIELGSIGSNLSLTTDSIKSPIPRGAYMVNLMLVSSTYNTNSTTHSHSGGTHSQMSGTGSHSHDGGAHTHRLPEAFRSLREGDRVLVAWCGHEPVVIAIVVSS